MNQSFQVKRLQKEDVPIFRQLILLFNEVFETNKDVIPRESYLLDLLNKPSFHAYVILIENEVVGGLTAYELINSSFEGIEMFIYDIAIKPAFQRKGLGKQLIASLKEYCRENNIGTIFVEAHESDKHAIDFYHSTGGKAEKVVHFNYNLRDN